MRNDVITVIELPVNKEPQAPQPAPVGAAVDEKGWPAHKPAMR